MMKQLSYLMMMMAAQSAMAQFSHYSWIHDLKVRDQPSTEGKVMMRLMEGEGVNYANEKSKTTDKITLRGKEYDAVWFKVTTQSGTSGWVHSAALTGTAPNTKMYAWVADLRVRDKADFDATALTKLAENEQVSFTGKRSEKKVKTKLREVEYTDYWMEITTKAGVKGWSHGAGLKYLNDTYHDAADPVPQALNTSEARAAWWKKLSNEWKSYFLETQLGNEWGVSPSKSVSDKDLVKILSLESIDISNNDGCATGPYYSATLTDLSGISQLTKLKSVSANYIVIKDLHDLHLLESLEYLNIAETQYQSLAGIESLTSLHSLTIGLQKAEDINALSSLVNLETLWLSGDISTLKVLAYMPKMGDLTISGSSERKISLDGIEKCTKLESFSFYAGALDETSAGKLRDLQLKTFYTSLPAFDAQLLPATLTMLHAYETNLKNLSALSLMPNLESLAIGNPLHRFNEIPVLPNLKWLSLSAPEMTSLKGIQAFSRLQNVQFNMYTTKLPASELSNLLQLSELKDLYLRYDLYEEDTNELRALKDKGVFVEFMYDEGGC